MSGEVQRKNGSIVLLDDTGAEQRRWNFREGWPTKWTGPSLNATGNEVAIETLEIAHEGLVKA
jgi:phage tail-like protein